MKFIFFSLFTFFCCLQITWAQLIEYKWEPQYYANIDGAEYLAFMQEMSDTKLTAADLDADLDFDILVGDKSGRVAYFENVGNDKNPKFRMKEATLKAIFEDQTNDVSIQVGKNAAPFLVDIDGDDDFDLMIGNGDGELWYFENIGNSTYSRFSFVTKTFQGIQNHPNLVPFFIDVNGDNRPDLIFGTRSGKVFYHQNKGTRTQTLFDSQPKQIAIIDKGHNATPAFVDWDQDFDLDLIIGQRQGTLVYWENIGNSRNPEWQEKEMNFQELDVGGESAPLLIDLNGDSLKDALIGNGGIQIPYFENRNYNEKQVLWSVEANFFKYRKFLRGRKNIKISAADIDNDGDQDLALGDATGKIAIFKNEGYQNGIPSFTTFLKNAFPNVNFSHASPEFGDIDKDGLVDLLIGSLQGGFFFFKNNGTNTDPQWEGRNITFDKIPKNSAIMPRFKPFTEGGLNLYVSTQKGELFFYEKENSQRIFFETKTPHYQDSLPMIGTAFFDINKNQKPALFFGDQQSKIYHIYPKDFLYEEIIETENEEIIYSFNNALFEMESWENYHAVDKIYPYFFDLDQDSFKDFFVSDNNGDILFFRQDEARKRTTEELIELSLLVKKQTILKQGEEYIVPIIDPKFITQVQVILKPDYLRATPTFGDIDGDGDYDLITGSHEGKIRIYENIGTKNKWEFQEKEEIFGPAIRQKNTSPHLVDLDQDGDLDLLIGSEVGRIFFYENIGNKEKYEFKALNTVFKNFRAGVNANPTAIISHESNQYEIIIGNMGGGLVQLRPNNTQDPLSFSVYERDFLDIDVGLGSVPNFSDLNNDKIPEILMGSDFGEILVLKKDENDKWKVRKDYIPKNFTFPLGTFPVAVDLDGDNDKDLVVGIEKEKLLYFENTAL